MNNRVGLQELRSLFEHLWFAQLIEPLIIILHLLLVNGSVCTIIRLNQWNLFRIVNLNTTEFYKDRALYISFDSGELSWSSLNNETIFVFVKFKKFDNRLIFSEGSFDGGFWPFSASSLSWFDSESTFSGCSSFSWFSSSLGSELEFFWSEFSFSLTIFSDILWITATHRKIWNL